MVLISAKISSSKKNQRRLVDGEFAFNLKSLMRRFDADPRLKRWPSAFWYLPPTAWGSNKKTRSVQYSLK
jgi:hypothetical protein